MYLRTTFACLFAIVCFSQSLKSAEKIGIQNLLCNPEFGFRADGSSLEEGRTVTCWNRQNWGDISAVKKNEKGAPASTSAGNFVRIKPGKKFWQFATLPDLGLSGSATVSLAVKGYQKKTNALRATLCVMQIESEQGEWSPADFGMSDKRTFAKHARGELVRASVIEKSSTVIDKEFQLTLEGLKIDARFKYGKKSSSKFRNVAGVLVEFENRSDQDVWIHSPSLVPGTKAVPEVKSSRPLPEYYRRIPKTLQKLKNGEPVYILTLGSSIDRGSANPPLYLYDEDPKSKHYKEPLCDCRNAKRADFSRFLVENQKRPDLQNYIGWWQHYFMYTGRTRLELMRKFNVPVDKILLNVMACDGSSIGESHSGFQEYVELGLSPSENMNGHPAGKSWKELYPDFFVDEKSPAPDLIIFGHGHNEHIDRPDEIAAYEGAVRWFQKRYPHVEFVSCMWIRDKGKENSISQPMEKLCKHYGIPFVDVGQMITELEKTCNRYAIAADGGHPSTAAHYLWAKQLEKVFEIPANAMPDIPQRILPKRMNGYTYGWEGEITRYDSQSERFVKKRLMIIDECAFNIWSSNRVDNKNELTKLNIDGKPAVNAGHGRHSWSKPYPRNSSFVHGRLSLGDRHIIELTNPTASLSYIDCKVCPNRKFFGADSECWQTKRDVKPFESTWGSPYGNKMFRLATGDAIEIAVEATDYSIAYLDQPDAGVLIATVDGKKAFSQKTNIPFEDSTGKKYFIENRRGIRGLKYQKHRLRLQAINKDVIILGLYSYDTR